MHSDAAPRQPLASSTPDPLQRLIDGGDWDYADLPADDSVHALHPYPAKFIPQVPRRLIDALSKPGDLVLDPFSGGGTTGVEALSAGRNFHGIDANPLGALLGKVKTEVLSPESLAACDTLLAALSAPVLWELAARGAWRPEIPNVDKWYDPLIFELLVGLRAQVMGVGEDAARQLALLVFANAAAKASYQESETRYVSKPRVIKPESVLSLFERDLKRAARLASGSRFPAGVSARFAEGDAKDASLYPVRVDLAVTSPPYPNSFDYHLYHRFRLFWLGPGPMSLRSREIGSHLKHQSDRDPATSYMNDMRVVLETVHAVLVPGGYFALVVGDGIYKGVTFETSARLADLAVDLGYESVHTVTRRLPTHRRSVAKAGRRLQEEQILLLRRPATAAVLIPPNYKLFPYESVLADREAEALAALDSVRRAESDGGKRRRLDRAAFSHAYEASGEVRQTMQFFVEGAPAPTSRRKNSTYLAHGLHRYKGKFYPQLAKALLNISGIDRGDRVIDPFGGSGTVALEANLLGIDAMSLDCNPVAISVARAKTDVLHLDEVVLGQYLTGLITAAKKVDGNTISSLQQFKPEIVPELESWFPLPVLVKLDKVLATARSHDDERVVNLGLALISDIIREVSQQDPKDLRIRRRAEPLADADVSGLLIGRVCALLDKLEAHWAAPASLFPTPGDSEVVLGDSACPSVFPHVRAQAVVSSPPYAAALPYIDTDRLSLAAVYGYSMRDRKSLESTMIGSREVTTRERRSIEATLEESPDSLGLPDSTLTFLISYMEAVRADASAGFRRQQAPAVLTRYFEAMSSVLNNVAAHLDPGSDIWMVLGDSRSVIGGTKWQIPTVDEVLSIGKHRGLDLVETIPITVTREDVLHSRNSIVENQILRFRTPSS